MKIIIAGGRSFQWKNNHVLWLISLLNKLKCNLVLSGKAKGVHAFGEKIAQELEIPIKYFSVEWKKYKKSAGPKRNKETIEYADCLILFPGGAGTENIKSLAQKKGIPVLEYQEEND